MSHKVWGPYSRCHSPSRMSGGFWASAEPLCCTTRLSERPWEPERKAFFCDTRQELKVLRDSSWQDLLNWLRHGGDGEEGVEDASRGSSLLSLVDQDATNRDVSWLPKVQADCPMGYTRHSWAFLTNELFESHATWSTFAWLGSRFLQCMTEQAMSLHCSNFFLIIS